MLIISGFVCIIGGFFSERDNNVSENVDFNFDGFLILILGLLRKLLAN